MTIKWDEVENLTGGSFSTLINVSGRQRMLSQRIIMLTLNCHLLYKENKADDFTQSLKMLSDAIELFKTSHYDLLNGNPDKKLPKLPSDKLQFKLKDEGVEQLIEEFIKKADELKTGIEDEVFIDPVELNNVVMHVASTVLNSLNELTAIYEEEFHAYSAYQRSESIKQELRIQQEENARNELANLNAILEEKILERTQDLKASESRVRAVLNNITEGIAVVDGAGFIQSINPAGASMFNCSETNLENTCLTQLLNNTNNPIEEFQGSNNSINVSGIVTTFGRQTIECIGTQSDGATFPIECVFSEMPLADQTMYIWVMRDISERKEAEMRLEQAQLDLLESAHQSGMAEIATGVLHNIGNILNSVSLSAEEVNRLVKEIKFPMFDKAVTMLTDNRDNITDFLTTDPKGSKLIDYFVVLNDSFSKGFTSTKSEIEHMKSHIEMIKDVISTQQEYAKGNHYSETLDINRLIEDALKIERNSLNKNFIYVSTNLNQLPDCEVHKSKLLQVITNLLKNAKEATLENKNIEQRKISIESSKLDSHFAYIRIKDNGIGISEEDISKVFQHGFTTKEAGHGFGLHASIVAMKEMKGNITAESEGINQGTTFTVTVPLSKTSLIN